MKKDFNKPVCNKWIPCSEMNYWTDEPGYITIVRYKLDEGGDYTVNTQTECPYGWNVLENWGDLMNIKL